MNKLIVTLLAFGLISAIIWWFFGGKKANTAQAEQSDDLQTATITVDGGYKPNVISLSVGKPAKITFLRKDPSNCLAEIIMSDFGIAEKLPLNQPFNVTILPKTAGKFTYTCGMRMFSGYIEVK